MRLDEEDGCVLEDGVADFKGDFADDAGAFGDDDVLHLQGFEHGDGLALLHGVAHRHLEVDDHALEGRSHGCGAGGADGVGRCLGRRLGDRGRALQGEHGEGVVGIDIGSGLLHGGFGLKVARWSAVDGEQVRCVFLHIAGVNAAVGEGRGVEESGQKAGVAAGAFDLEFGEATLGFLEGGRQVGRVRDDFGEERVVVRAGGVAGVAEAIDSDARAGGRFVGGEHAAAGARLAIFGHGFEIDAGLHRDSPRLGDAGLIEAEVT